MFDLNLKGPESFTEELNAKLPDLLARVGCNQGNRLRFLSVFPGLDRADWHTVTLGNLRWSSASR